MELFYMISSKNSNFNDLQSLINSDNEEQKKEKLIEIMKMKMKKMKKFIFQIHGDMESMSDPLLVKI